MSKKATSYRLTEDALRILTLLAEQLGLSQTGVIELAVRELAKRHDVGVRSDVRAR